MRLRLQILAGVASCETERQFVQVALGFHVIETAHNLPTTSMQKFDSCQIARAMCDLIETAHNFAMRCEDFMAIVIERGRAQCWKRVFTTPLLHRLRYLISRTILQKNQTRCLEVSKCCVRQFVSMISFVNMNNFS